MRLKKRLTRKIVDDTDAVRSSSGAAGLLRRGWVDYTNAIVKYSLACTNRILCSEGKGGFHLEARISA